MKPILAIIATLISLASFAQNSGKIIGTVKDGSSKIIESASITLLQAKDSSVVKIAVADKAGKYSFEGIQPGNYLVAVTAVGHQKGYSSTFSVTSDKSSINLETIDLVPQEKTMATVTVVAKRPLVEQKIDRTVVNVEASATNVGASALEVLEKSPGISVDKDGNISLKGKDGVVVLVDGRPTQLGAADLANYLKGMHANQLDQIEIMTNPPAKFDASGNAGVINIKTKKNKQFGYNGSVSLGYGYGRFNKFNEGFNFNYRKNKWNLFTNLSHNYRTYFNELDIERTFRDENTKMVTKFFEQEARMRSRSNAYSGKLGADFSASKNTTIGVVLNGFTNPGLFSNNNFTNIYQPPGTLQSVTKATVANESEWKNWSTNLNFRTVLDTTGRELTADLDYITYDSKRDQLLVNSYFDALGAPTEKPDSLDGSLPQNIDIYSGRIDYVQPMKKGRKFEAGLKSSLVRTDNNAVYDSVINGQIVHDYNRSNHFIYEENINAAYVNLSTPLSKKITAQLGLRLENTIAKGDQKTTGEKFDREYTQLFPTAYFQYKADDKNSFVLNYGRRINRPNYQSLNPFINFLDKYTYQQGNPNLKPQFSHNIELSHSFKGILTTTLNYNRTTDIIQQVIEQNEAKNETYVNQQNIAERNQYGLSVNANTKFAKWHSGNVYVNVFHNQFKGVVNDTTIDVSGTTLMLNASQQFTLGKGWSAEVSGFYRTKAVEGVVAVSGMGMLNLGLSKNIMNNNGSIRVNVRDILYTRQHNFESRYGTVDVKGQERGESRQVNVGFTYRFNKGKMNGGPKKRTNGSASEEQNRVGGGN
ncbi:MAG TPA: TonB-dependent receptor [Chitinophagaceae bacterium]